MDDKEYARLRFIDAINRALKSLSYEQVDDVFLYVMQIYNKVKDDERNAE